MPHAPEACKAVVDVLLAGLVCMRTPHFIHSATGPPGGDIPLLAVATESKLADLKGDVSTSLSQQHVAGGLTISCGSTCAS